MQTPVEAIVSMAQIVLRVRKEWHAGATAHDDIDRACNNVADLLPGITVDMLHAAIAELKRRSTPHS